MLELSILSVVGAVLMIIGLALIIDKRSIAILHSYHYKKVKEEDKNAFTKIMGLGMIINASSVLATGLIDYFTKTYYGWIVFGVGLVIGFAIMWYALRKYNGGVFS